MWLIKIELFFSLSWSPRRWHSAPCSNSRNEAKIVSVIFSMWLAGFSWMWQRGGKMKDHTELLWARSRSDTCNFYRSWLLPTVIPTREFEKWSLCVWTGRREMSLFGVYPVFATLSFVSYSIENVENNFYFMACYEDRRSYHLESTNRVPGI